MFTVMSSVLSQAITYTILVLGFGLGIGISIPFSVAASSVINTPAVPLQKIQQVRVETLALTERGLQDSSSLHQVVGKRLTQAGFTPVHDANTPSDVVVRVKCEERKTQTGPSRHRKGGHALSTASRLWKGPACRVSYRYQGKPSRWSREIQAPFEDPLQAAKAADASNAGQYALHALQTQLAQDEFPLYLAADWGQADRLIQVFQQAADQPDRRRLILQLLGPLSSPAALATIKEALTNPELALAAIVALGDQGEIAISSLINILNSSERPEHKLAALRSLGEIATHSSPPTLYDVFVKQLKSQDPRMQAIAVRGLGRLGDLRAVTPIEALNIQAWSNPSTHADMQALREALNWSLYQLDASSSSH